MNTSYRGCQATGLGQVRIVLPMTCNPIETSVKVRDSTFNIYDYIFTSVPDFPARLFIEHLFELTLLRSESYTKRPPHTKFHVLVVSITSRLESYDDVFEPHRVRLGQALNMSTRRSPKRRSISEETDIIRSVTIIY